MRPNDEEQFVKKNWGWELWFANVQEKNEVVEYEDLLNPKTTDYCGKILYIRHNEWSSGGRYHYHKIKDETFHVLEGFLQLDIVDKNDRTDTVILSPGKTFRLKPGTKHRFTSLSQTGCKFIEVSTFHSDDDSYRCSYDIESGEWLEWPPSA